MNGGCRLHTTFAVLHRFLTRDVVSMSLLVVWAASQCINSAVMLEFVSTVPFRKLTDNAVPSYGYSMSDTATMGRVMTTAPIFLLLETVELQDGEWRSIVEVLERRWLIICALLIFSSFSTIATDGRTSQIPAICRTTRYSSTTHEGNPLGTAICGGAFPICGGAFDDTFPKLRAPISRSESVFFGDFLFTSLLDYPFHLVFLCRQYVEDSL